MIYTNGDSWSMSYTLDQPTVWPNHNMDLPVWPNMLAKDLNQELLSEGIGCGSNSRILDCLEDVYLTGKKPSYIVLALSAFHRWHLPAPGRNHWVIGPLVALNNGTGEKDEFIQKWYYTNCDDKLDSIFRHYKTVWGLVNLCEKIGSKYTIFNCWDKEIYNLNLLESETNIEEFVTGFYKDNTAHPACTKYIESFFQLRNLSKTWNYIEKPLSSFLSESDYKDDGHPNEHGHLIIKNHIMDYIIQQ